MKKLLTLVLVLAVASMASAAATFTVTDNLDGTVDIDYTGEIVGLALDIDSDVNISAVSLPAFFDVYMDYAYAEGSAYVYGEGTPIAAIAAAGTASLPATDFCISAGGLEDDELDVAPTSGTITLTIADYATLAEGTYTITVAENSLRGGVVGFDGAMTTDLETTGSVDIVIAGSGDTPEQIEWDGMNMNGDGFVNTQDVTSLVGFIDANGAAPFYSIASSSPAYDAAYDVNGDGFINTQDVTSLVGYIDANGTPPFYSIVRP